jgi:Family of unknown function (DUF6311)
MIINKKRLPFLNIRIYSQVIPTLIGAICFSKVVGINVLIPSNIAWFAGGVNSDMLQHYLGWSFYRDSPWRLPLGLNPDYGLELSNSIVYTDSIPLLAIFFKLFDPLLGKPFQYFGIWLLACFILQSTFCWKIINKFTNSVALLAGGTILSLFSPIFLFRINMHMALAGQFLILIAIYLSISELSKSLFVKWKFLLCLSLLVHAYLFLVILLLWFFFILKTLKSESLFQTSKEFFTSILLIVFLSFLVGYFEIAPGDQYGAKFGVFRWNLLSPITPGGWSFFLNDFVPIKGNDEGFSYLGLGQIMLSILLVFACVIRRDFYLNLIRKHFHLCVALFCLSILAISNEVAIGNLRFSLSLPDSWIELLSVFRASGRFIWPTIYCVLLLSLFSTLVLFQKQIIINLLVISLAILQIIDTHVGWQKIAFQNIVPSSRVLEYSSKEISLVKRFDIIRVIPISNEHPFWVHLGYLASQSGSKTNAVYLSRIDKGSVNTSAFKTLNLIKSGSLDPDTIYALTEKQFYGLSAEIEAHRLTWQIIEGIYYVYKV